MATNVRRQQADTQTQWETEMTAFKTALAAAVASIAVALGATALTSAPASAKFLPLTHLPPVTQANPGAVPGNIITPGLPGAFGNGTKASSFWEIGLMSRSGIWPVGKISLYGVPAGNVWPFSPTSGIGDAAVEVAMSGKTPLR